MADDEMEPESRFANLPCVLFDFDGTIADTTGAVCRTARAALTRCGYDVEAAGDLNILIGPPLHEGFMLLLGVDLDESKRITAVYREIFNAEVRLEDYPVLPGMAELLRRLRERGTKIGVATSRLEETANQMIASLDLPPFDAIVGRVEPGLDTKADCIREALHQLGVCGSEAVMVGDRHHDVEGAHANGMPCIGLYSGTARPGEHEEAGADLICRSIPEVAAGLGVDLS